MNWQERWIPKLLRKEWIYKLQLNQQRLMIAIATHEPDLAAQTKRTLQVKNGLVIDDAKASAGAWSDRVRPEMI